MTSPLSVTRILFFFYRPKALLLHLKRFIVVEKPQPAVDDNTSEKAGGGDENAHPNSPSSRRSRPVEYEFQKNKAPVEIAERLSLANFLSTSEESTEESSKSAGEYKIQSIVHHIGSRASSGHYTADALRRSKDLPVEHANNDEKDADDKKEEGNNNKDGDQHDKSSTPNPRNDDASLDSGAARSKAIADKKGNSEEQSLSAASGPGQEQEEWISFDDTNSGRNTFANIAGSNFKQRTAYMLLYKFSPSAAAASTGTTPTAPLPETCKVADDSAPPAEPAPMEL
jgi:preprotein translocase subunit SecD